MGATLRLKQPPEALPLELEAFLAVERARTAAAGEADAPPAATGEADAPPAATAPPLVSHRKTELREVEKLLRDLAPRAFLKPARPLKIGITEDLLALLTGEVEPVKVRRFMSAWCRRDAYLFALTYGGPRFDLDGHPVGTVTEEQQARARRLLAERGLEP